MGEDKLSHDERLRLECLAQAIASHGGRPPSPELLVQEALTFERYVSDGGVR